MPFEFDNGSVGFEGDPKLNNGFVVVVLLSLCDLVLKRLANGFFGPVSSLRWFSPFCCSAAFGSFPVCGASSAGEARPNSEADIDDGSAVFDNEPNKLRLAGCDVAVVSAVCPDINPDFLGVVPADSDCEGAVVG